MSDLVSACARALCPLCAQRAPHHGGENSDGRVRWDLHVVLCHGGVVFEECLAGDLLMKKECA